MLHDALRSLSAAIFHGMVFPYQVLLELEGTPMLILHEFYECSKEHCVSLCDSYTQVGYGCGPTELDAIFEAIDSLPEKYSAWKNAAKWDEEHEQD